MDMVLEKQAKLELRDNLLRKLLSLTQEELKRRSEDVTTLLCSLSIYQRAKCIMVYYPLKGEVDILRLVWKAFTIKRFCFPVMDMTAKSLKIFEVNNLETDFIKGPYGVLQPDTQKAKEVNIRDIELIIAPGLAFDRQKNRLGRGAGFYDRFLKKINPPTLKVGVAFEFQILESLPTHPSFDEKVDIVVSEHFLV
jgi:5-formyltetrahydrofolate cyclo-ligase